MARCQCQGLRAGAERRTRAGGITEVVLREGRGGGESHSLVGVVVIVDVCVIYHDAR